ncbi:hypothetical protein [Facklamia sp. 7083-14-GEN3]|nr:hypothetical protein [Facklamia sp. 7083-14-GEN3]MCR8969057.1 hypothetical protein [Facklamia sp. 7083-14-GEN3]
MVLTNKRNRLRRGDNMAEIKLRRAYDQKGQEDGDHMLVDRL